MTSPITEYIAWLRKQEKDSEALIRSAFREHDAAYFSAMKSTFREARLRAELGDKAEVKT